MDSNEISHAALARLAESVGLSLFAVLPIDIDLSNDSARLQSWQELGYAGDMSYMLRSAQLLTSPREFLPEARSIAVFAVNYSRRARSVLPPGCGRIARYAWGRDYHRLLPKKIKLLVSCIERELGGRISARVFSDAVPLLERALGREAGLGFIGKNSLLIRPGSGSFFFLAEVLWNLEVTDASALKVIGNCGSCSRCSVQCPTQAIVKDRVVDARRCISYLTIEKRGVLELWEREAIAEWLFGCDICQEICPFNHAPLDKEERADYEQLESGGVGECLNLCEVLAIRNVEDFRKRFAGTALMRAGREGLLRNAAVVAGNTRSQQVIPALEECMRADSSELVREHAAWALQKM